MQDFFLNIVWLVLLLPLLACVINGLFGRRWAQEQAGLLPVWCSWPSWWLWASL